MVGCAVPLDARAAILQYVDEMWSYGRLADMKILFDAPRPGLSRKTTAYFDHQRTDSVPLHDRDMARIGSRTTIVAL